jgi:hypothetical protein
MIPWLPVLLPSHFWRNRPSRCKGKLFRVYQIVCSYLTGIKLWICQPLSYTYTAQNKHTKIRIQNNMSWLGFEPTVPLFERQNSITILTGDALQGEGHETGYSAASKVEVMNEWSYNSTSSYVFIDWRGTAQNCLIVDKDKWKTLRLLISMPTLICRQRSKQKFNLFSM